MSKTPNYAAAVKSILDATKPGERVCALTGEKWMMDEEEIGWYKKFNVPPSKYSPTARVSIVASFATGFGWWWQKHPETGKPVLTYVHPATGVKALPDAEFFEADRTDKARDYDSSRSFMDQMRALQLEVPFTASRSLIPTHNSIALLSQGDENSYFVTASRSKNSFYLYSSLDIEKSAEVYESSAINQSYNVLNSHRIFKCKFVRQSYDCMESAFLFDCRNCEYCFGASGKRNRKYVWWNEQLSKEEWEKRRASVDLGSRAVTEEMIRKFRDLAGSQAVWPENFNEHAENCVGEYLYKCRDCKYILFGHDGPQNNYWGTVYFGRSEQNAFTGGCVDSTENYYSHAPLKSHLCKWTHSCVSCQSVEYSMQCWNCENCFGCVGLNRKKFCIFNRQYTEEEYWQKLDEIKTHLLETGELGEFFPLSFSPCCVLASPGLMYLSTEEDVKQLGGMVYNPDSAGALGDVSTTQEMKKPEDIPDHIRDMDPEVWSKMPVFDAKENRRYAFLRPEIELYKEIGVAPSSTHPMTRLKNLVFEANMGVFEETHCKSCSKAITVSKNRTYPNRTIYCRSCYVQYLEKNG